MEFTAKQIAEIVNGEIVGNQNVKVSRFAKIEDGENGSLSFLANSKYTQYIYTTKSDVVLVNKTFVPEKQISSTLIKVDDAYQALGQLLAIAEKLKQNKKGISSKADIDESAILGKDIFIDSFVVIGKNCKIGNNVKIYANSYIADCVEIKDDSIIYPNTTIYEKCKIGERNIIHSGAVIGADGFGFAPDKKGDYTKIPQIGNVVLGNDVEVGANSTIDRATFSSTTIGNGVKIDNLVQIAHNVEIGDGTAIAAQSGIAGSTKVGKHCILAGQVGIAGHLEIADNTIFGAQTGVTGHIKEKGQIYQGSPHMPIANFRRSSVALKQLPELMRVVTRLEKELEMLKLKS